MYKLSFKSVAFFVLPRPRFPQQIIKAGLDFGAIDISSKVLLRGSWAMRKYKAFVQSWEHGEEALLSLHTQAVSTMWLRTRHLATESITRDLIALSVAAKVVTKLQGF